LSAIPEPNPGIQKKRILLEGDVPSPTHPPRGCVFRSRCFKKIEACDSEKAPPSQEVEEGHFVSCYLYSERQGKI
jgi:oligopeptide/dipeptide ABC transporter ATP-binding protein